MAEIQSTIQIAKRRAGGDEIVPDFELNPLLEEQHERPSRSVSCSWKDRYQQIARSRASSVGSASTASSPASVYLTRINSRLTMQKSSDQRPEQVEFDPSLRYKLGSIIGSGGFSVVRKAFDKDGNLFAIKIIDKRAGDLSQEIEIWKSLKHPNILPLISVHETHSSVYLLSTCFPAGTLFDLVHRSRPALPIKKIQSYLLQLISAVKYMHSKTILHRDIKPENCLVDPNGMLMLCDFGLSEYAGTQIGSPKLGPSNSSAALPGVHQSEAMGGSYLFASPELLDGVSGYASDVWATGVVFYTCLTGGYPWQHSLTSKLKLMVQIDDYDASCLPENSRSLVEMCLRKDPEKRATMEEVEVAALRQWV